MLGLIARNARRLYSRGNVNDDDDPSLDEPRVPVGGARPRPEPALPRVLQGERVLPRAGPAHRLHRRRRLPDALV